MRGSWCVIVCQQGVHLAALLHHHCRRDRQLNALPYKVKMREAAGKEEGQEEPVTVTMLFAAGQLGRPETPVWPHSLTHMRTHSLSQSHMCTHSPLCMVSSFLLYLNRLSSVL